MHCPLSSKTDHVTYIPGQLIRPIVPSIARTLADWVTEYGPVITLRQGSHIIVVIGRVDVRFLFCSMYHVH